MLILLYLGKCYELMRDVLGNRFVEFVILPKQCFKEMVHQVTQRRNIFWVLESKYLYFSFKNLLGTADDSSTLFAVTARKPTLRLWPTFTKYMLCALSSPSTSSYPAHFPSACLFSFTSNCILSHGTCVFIGCPQTFSERFSALHTLV